MSTVFSLAAAASTPAPCAEDDQHVVLFAARSGNIYYVLVFQRQ
jgi:hypothetical protein